jgi:hypothetical protein
MIALREGGGYGTLIHLALTCRIVAATVGQVYVIEMPPNNRNEHN